VKFTATVNSFVGNSGFGGPPTTPCAGGSLGGIPVTWLHPQLDEHGTTTVQSGFGNTVTDATGRTTMTFVADPEEDRAWERGPQVTALGHVGVIIEQADVARALCPGIPTGRGTTVSNLTNPLILRIRYHVPRAILVILTNPFDILFKGGSQVGGDADLEGEDFYVGRLEERPDGIWHGFFLGRTSGGGTGVFWAADRTCASSYAAYQVLEVFGESGPARLPSDPILTSNGNFRLDFYAEAPVVAQVGTRLCSAALRPGGRYPWAPFNSPFVWSGIGLGINLPPDPGGTSQYLEVPENSTVEYKGLTGWIVDIRYLKPPEPPP
jgi:hypothetical protein